MNLGLIYFVEVVLLGRKRTNKIEIELKYLKLVENMTLWNQYPRGTISYKKTHDSLLRALIVGYTKNKGNVKISKGSGGTIRGRGSIRGM